jgi:hypothetical protein
MFDALRTLKGVTLISVSMRYEKQFQQVQGKHIAPDGIGRAVSRWVDPLEDGGVL